MNDLLFKCNGGKLSIVESLWLKKEFNIWSILFLFSIVSCISIVKSGHRHSSTLVCQQKIISCTKPKQDAILSCRPFRAAILLCWNHWRATLCLCWSWHHWGCTAQRQTGLRFVIPKQTIPCLVEIYLKTTRHANKSFMIYLLFNNNCSWCIIFVSCC